jgi:3D-(3,5/4)-trihydroxycyclohexane-1,2-dione acylhydrolase (decyclizing)
MAAAAGDYAQAARQLLAADRVVMKIGGGARGCGTELLDLADLIDAVLVMSPISVGIVPSSHPRCMTVGGSKGSISGNYAMEHADALLAVGTRAVCQSDSSRTGYPGVQQVDNINTDVDAALHYQRTIALVGDAQPTLRLLIRAVRERLAATGGAATSEAATGEASAETPQSPWLRQCRHKRAEWEAFKQERFDNPVLFDEVWQTEVLTQPAAIQIAVEEAHRAGAVAFFDAGDVQANGFQLAVDEREGTTITDGGASYMGFAASAVLATGLGSGGWRAAAMSGDGSFTMNPAVLIDAVEHHATGVIVVFDNRRMGAISSLQSAQYGHVHATNDSVAVDYVAWAQAVAGVLALHGGHTPAELRDAMRQALACDGLALVHVPVYYGDDPLGGLGAYGHWNVGNWVADTQALRHDIGL